MNKHGYFTDHTNNSILDLLLGGKAITSPPTYFLGLSSTPLNKKGDYVEPVGNGYARVAIPNNSDSFTAANAGIKANQHRLVFPAPTGPWGKVQTLFISDAPTGGVVYTMASLTIPCEPQAGDEPPSVAPDAFYISFT